MTGFPVINDPLYNHTVFGPNKGKGGIVGKTDAQLIQDLIAIHNAENWLGMDGDSELSMFNKNGDKEGKEDMADLTSPSKTPSPNNDTPSAGNCTFHVLTKFFQPPLLPNLHARDRQFEHYWSVNKSFPVLLLLKKYSFNKKSYVFSKFCSHIERF